METVQAAPVVPQAPNKPLNISDYFAGEERPEVFGNPRPALRPPTNEEKLQRHDFVAQKEIRLYSEPYDIAARQAVFDPVAPELAARDQIESVESKLVWMAERVQRLVKTYPYKEREEFSPFNIANRVTSVAECRPAGCYVNDLKFAERVCGYHKACPWCHYRKFTELYQQVALYGQEPCSMVTGLVDLPFIPFKICKKRKALGNWCRVNFGTTQAVWLLMRPAWHNQVDLEHSDIIVYEIRVLVVGTNRQIKLPGIPYLQHKKTRPANEVTDKWLPDFYNYQPELLLDNSAIRHLWRLEAVTHHSEALSRLVRKENRIFDDEIAYSSPI